MTPNFDVHQRKKVKFSNDTLLASPGSFPFSSKVVPEASTIQVKKTYELRVYNPE